MVTRQPRLTDCAAISLTTAVDILTIGCAGLAAARRRQNVVVERFRLRLVSLPGRHRAARQQLPQQAFQNRHRRRQVPFYFTAAKSVEVTGV